MNGTTGDRNTAADWYRQAVMYQIYPRSFADGNGDGLGDLRGIADRVEHLVRLGVDGVWLSPFYPSALADGGYDVDDPRDVDPRLGTLADFDHLVRVLHEAGIRVIVDIVPNHTGSGHRWFREALQAGPGSPVRERYVFRDGDGDGDQPPTDWQAIFGGSMWEPVGDGQWYLHQFDVSQPDLNWDNPEVLADFEQTLRFWSDRGVDGFRVDVAHGLKKDLSEPLPTFAELNAQDYDLGNGRLRDRDEVHDVYRSWRRVFDEYEPPRVAVAEAWVGPDRRPAYAAPDGLGQAFNFDLLNAAWDAPTWRRVISDNLDLAARSGSTSTWVLSNHDVTRHATRYGLPVDERDGREFKLTAGAAPAPDHARGQRRARVGTAVILALPGSAYLYQGEELGLPEVVGIPDAQRQDPTFFRSPGIDVGRDGCRVPLPWTRTGPSFGFGEGGSHLPQPSWWGDFSVEVEEHDPSSMLNFYVEAINRRHSLQTAEELTFKHGSAHVLHFARPDGWECVANFGEEPVPLPEGSVVLTTGQLGEQTVPGETAVWLLDRPCPAQPGVV